MNDTTKTYEAVKIMKEFGGGELIHDVINSPLSSQWDMKLLAFHQALINDLCGRVSALQDKLEKLEELLEGGVAGAVKIIGKETIQ